MAITRTELNKLNTEELSQLNRMIVEMIKTKRANDNISAIYTFRSGDSVTFKSPRSGQTYRGEVTQIKRTKVVVKTEIGNYLVPASMLSKCA